MGLGKHWAFHTGVAGIAAATMPTLARRRGIWVVRYGSYATVALQCYVVREEEVTHSI